jgi:hypothetical protein
MPQLKGSAKTMQVCVRAVTEFDYDDNSCKNNKGELVHVAEVICSYTYFKLLVIFTTLSCCFITVTENTCVLFGNMEIVVVYIALVSQSVNNILI